MSQVLLLNATYEPLRFISFRRAVILVLKEKAEILETRVERQLRAEKASFPYPLVVRLVVYAPVPRFMNIPLTRKNLFSRDSHTCQYCGASGGNLTVDHVIPLSRGGKNEWSNVVAACSFCNHKKGNRLPQEARMFPGSRPVKPNGIALVLLGQARAEESWSRYLKL